MSTRYDLSRVSNFQDTLRDALGRLIAVGTANTGSTQPLAALQHVIDDNPDGFARDSAALVVVIVSASDDASPGAIADFVRKAKQAKPDPANVFVVGITTPGLPRLDEFFAGFPYRFRMASLGDGDISSAFEPLNYVRTTLGIGCWHVPDIDPDTPGAQYDCTFTAQIRDVPQALPPCKAAGDLFCWLLEDTSQGCVCPSSVEPVIRPYPWSVFRPPFRAECVVVE